MSKQTGIPVTDYLFAAQIEGEDAKQYADALADVGFPGTARDADTMIEQGLYESRTALLENMQGRQAQAKVQAASDKAYNNKLATLRGEQDFFAKQAGGMKRRPAQQDVNRRDHAIADVERLWRRGDIDARQAGEHLDGIIADKPRETYSPVEPTVQEDWAKDFAIVQRPMPDGSMSRPFMVRRGRKTPQNPTGETHFEGWIGAKGKGMDLDFGSYYRSLSPTQRQALYRDTHGELFLTQKEGQPDPTPPDVYKAMEAKYDIFGELYPVEQPGAQPAAQGAQPGQGTPGGPAQVSPPVQRATQVVETLLQRANQKPIDTWADQELVLAGEAVDAAVLDIEQSGSKDPNLLKLLAQLLEFSDVINAQRNR
jgi:hypothetical protein